MVASVRKVVGVPRPRRRHRGFPERGLFFFYGLGNYETAVTSDFPSEHVEINDGVQELAFKELAFEKLIFKVVNSQLRPLLRRRHGRLRRPGELELRGRGRVRGEPLPHAAGRLRPT